MVNRHSETNISKLILLFTLILTLIVSENPALAYIQQQEIKVFIDGEQVAFLDQKPMMII